MHDTWRDGERSKTMGLREMGASVNGDGEKEL